HHISRHPPRPLTPPDPLAHFPPLALGLWALGLWALGLWQTLHATAGPTQQSLRLHNPASSPSPSRSAGLARPNHSLASPRLLPRVANSPRIHRPARPAGDGGNFGKQRNQWLPGSPPGGRFFGLRGRGSATTQVIGAPTLRGGGATV